MSKTNRMTRSNRRTNQARGRGRKVREGGLQILSANLVPHAHDEGPRGFNFGPKWIKSIKERRGIAMYPSNLPKLLKTAEAYLPERQLKRVRTQAELVEALSRVV